MSGLEGGKVAGHGDRGLGQPFEGQREFKLFVA